MGSTAAMAIARCRRWTTGLERRPSGRPPRPLDSPGQSARACGSALGTAGATRYRRMNATSASAASALPIAGQMVVTVPCPLRFHRESDPRPRLDYLGVPARPLTSREPRWEPRERLAGFPDVNGQRAQTLPGSRTDLNGSGCPDGIYVSEGWGFESLRARSRNRAQRLFPDVSEASNP
jgi:hypothetical protein